MHQIKEIIRSYIVLRKVVLRTLLETKIDRYIILDAVNISANKYTKRRKDATAWTVDEIEQLAILFNLNPKACIGIKRLALTLDFVPIKSRTEILKTVHIDEDKLRTRRRNYNKWQLAELERMMAFIESIQ